MAFSVGKTALYQFRHDTKCLSANIAMQMTAGSSSFRRGLHIELGAREKALLADDPSLRRFKSNSKSVRALRRVGDALTLVVAAGCCYEIYMKAFGREETQKASERA